MAYIFVKICIHGALNHILGHRNMSVLPTKPVAPSAWLLQHAAIIKMHGRVLDLAAGYGRNSLWLAQQGFTVEAVDRDAVALSSLAPYNHIRCTVADLEAGAWPYQEASFDAVVVFRYLHRPLWHSLIDALAPNAVLIYETFMQGQEVWGRPQRAEFLLKPNELIDVLSPHLWIADFEQGLLQQEPPAMLQRICAIKQ
jgi:SAM-dependent methyltransferase